MASLLVLLHLLPPTGGQRSPKISASDASQRLLVFHKSCCSLEEHLCNQQGRRPNLLTVRHQKSKTDTFYITMEEHLIPCQARHSLGAFDELFKAHFVFNLSQDNIKLDLLFAVQWKKTCLSFAKYVIYFWLKMTFFYGKQVVCRVF